MASMIRGSVGQGGFNNAADVRIVQRLLNETIPHGQVVLAIDGIVGPKTISAIRLFQKTAGLRIVDGRVDPGGPTINCLAKCHIEGISKGLKPDFLVVARNYSVSAELNPAAINFPALLVEYLNLLRRC